MTKPVTFEVLKEEGSAQMFLYVTFHNPFKKFSIAIPYWTDSESCANQLIALASTIREAGKIHTNWLDQEIGQ